MSKNLLLTIFYGPMSSGKTENSIKYIIDSLDSNKTYQNLELIIPNLNGVTAYHNAKNKIYRSRNDRIQFITSENISKKYSVKTNFNIIDINRLNYLVNINDNSIIVIDEAQFFSYLSLFIKFVFSVKNNIHLIISGLNSDFKKQDSFSGKISNISNCNFLNLLEKNYKIRYNVIELTTICKNCNNYPAQWTHKCDSKWDENTSVIQPGEVVDFKSNFNNNILSKYIPVCTKCWFFLNNSNLKY
tara:strand:- start:46 stop:777 length:732 start_codon:yes stop_codon:yes gene_type:complete